MGYIYIKIMEAITSAPTKLFFKMYPAKPKIVRTPQGIDLRKTLRICLIFHIIFFVVSLMAIGYSSMISEVAFAILCYSCYLTLREWTIILYWALLFLSIFLGIMNLFEYRNIRILFYILNEIFYGVAIYYVGIKYRKFR